MKKIIIQLFLLLLLSGFAKSQNKQIIDKTTGFDIYQFGLTKDELGCEYWICTKHPDMKVLDNEVVQVDLNFDYDDHFKLCTIFIKLETNNGILESLKKKYGNFRTEIVNDVFYTNVKFYIWEGDKILIAYYEENGYTYVKYVKILKKNIKEL